MKLKALWYCTKNKPYLQVNRCVLPTEYDRYILDKKQHYSAFGEPLEKLNGKIACVSDYEVEKIELLGDEINLYYGVEERACLTRDKIEEYFGYKNDYKGYAIYIKNLNVFDKPKELPEYYKKFEHIFYRPLIETHSSSSAIYIPESKIYFMDYCDVLKKAPQNMCYAFDKNGNKYVVISVRPEWLCQILNGFKDVELRKKVSKEML